MERSLQKYFVGEQYLPSERIGAHGQRETNQYARTWRHARRERSAAHRATVRIGQLGKVQSHERGTRHDDGDQPFENGREGRQMRKTMKSNNELEAKDRFIAVRLTFRFGKFARKPHEFLFEYGIVESLFVDTRCDLGETFPAFLFQFVPVLRLLFIYADKVLRKNIPREDRQQLIAEKNELQAKLGEITEERGRQQTVQDRLETIYTVLDGLKNRPMTYDDEVVRQLIDCVVVESKDRIKVIFCGGLQVEQPLQQEDMDFLSEMGPLAMH